MTPLHHAASKGNLTAVMELLQCARIKVDVSCFVRSCTICELASHARHASQHASRASQHASHASQHASQHASHTVVES